MNVYGVIEGQLTEGSEINGSVTPTGTVTGEISTGGSLKGAVSAPGAVSGQMRATRGLSGLIAVPAAAGGGDYMPLVDLGTFDIEEYDWDYWEYLADKTTDGFYKVLEEQDGFTYYFRVECTENYCYQEVWTTEEGGLMRNCRQGWSDGEGGWVWDDYTNWMTSDAVYSNFYTKGAVYNKNEVDTKLAGKVDNDTLGNYYTDVQVDDILENNYYTMDQVDELLEGFAPENMITTTWANLVSLRDNGQLTGGAYYRITDYNFVTTKLGIQSGNHPFDIVVLAISESMVSETAYAVRHAGDHYFEREVTEGGIEWLYTIYVDDYAESYGDEPVDHADDIHSGDVFCYADTDIHPDTGEEVPILYKTDADEYDFDDPDWEDIFYWCGTYDLDGDEYDLWGKYEDGVFMQQYALTPIVVEDGELVVSPIPETKTVPVNLNAWELKYCLDNDKELFAWADTNGKGVIYYMKDEFGNEAPYDFKNVKYARRWVSAVSNSILNNLKNQYVGESDYYAITTTASVQYRYTFDDNSGNDASLFGDASYNSIDTWIIDGQKQLNNIVTGYAKNSHFRPNTHNITVSNSCQNLDMQGDYCLFHGANLLTGSFRYCTMVGANNISAEGGLRTTIASGASTIKVSGNCYDMNWASNLTNSEFAGGSFGITFGNYCSLIKISSNCNTITFGTYCVNISIGAYCNTISFTSYWRYVDIMDNCSRLTFSTTGGSTTNYVQYITVRKAVTNVTLTPTRKLAYETIYYKTGKDEQAV